MLSNQQYVYQKNVYPAIECKDVLKIYDDKTEDCVDEDSRMCQHQVPLIQAKRKKKYQSIRARSG